MDWILIVMQLFIRAAMLDVWWIRYEKPVKFRGGNAKTMKEEFRLYGLPDWFRTVVRGLKLSCGLLMAVGIWFPSAAVFGGVILAVLMLGAMAMHFKVRDPLIKASPSTLFLALSAVVACFRWEQISLAL